MTAESIVAVTIRLTVPFQRVKAPTIALKVIYIYINIALTESLEIAGFLQLEGSLLYHALR